MVDQINDISEEDFEDKAAINDFVYESIMREKEVDRAKFASHWMRDEENLDKRCMRDLAARTNDLVKIKELLKKTDKPEDLLSATDDQGYSSLHRAASEDSILVAEYLIDKMKDRLDDRTNDGWTPLHCASIWNHAEIVSMLLNAGADVNALTNGHLSAFHLACNQSDNIEVISLLLMHPLLKTNNKSNAGDTGKDLGIRHTQHGDLFDEIFDDSLYISMLNVEDEENLCD
ncbi:hypothetical protein ACOME3_004839 [Neoechinorhynchus agilis]